MQYHKTDEAGGKEEIALERWVWSAQMQDGQTLWQFAFDGTFHAFSEIQLSKLTAFIMSKADDPARRIEIPIGRGMKPFLFYRNRRLNIGQEDERTERIYCFGWKTGKKSGAWFYILPDDRIVAGAQDIVFNN